MQLGVGEMPSAGNEDRMCSGEMVLLKADAAVVVTGNGIGLVFVLSAVGLVARLGAGGGARCGKLSNVDGEDGGLHDIDGEVMLLGASCKGGLVSLKAGVTVAITGSGMRPVFTGSTIGRVARLGAGGGGGVRGRISGGDGDDGGLHNGKMIIGNCDPDSLRDGDSGAS
jgi:hypothetical protein